MTLTDSQQDVARFMHFVCKVDFTNKMKPNCPTRAEIRLCLRLINEELSELTEAMWCLSPSAQEALRLDIRKMHEATGTYQQVTDKLAEVADGLGDLLYVVLYAANIYGIDMEPIFQEIQRSNISKVGGTKDEYGKLIKPPTYSPANIGPIIRRQLNDNR